MSIIFALLPLSLVLSGLGLGAYFWSLRSGQYDDLEREGLRPLFDDECPVSSTPEVTPSSSHLSQSRQDLCDQKHPDESSKQ